jgi:hypothetical protein
MAGGATGAFPARSKRNNDPVAGANPKDFAADGLNYPRAFMSEYGRKILAEHSVTRGYISVANTARHNADERFVLPWAVEIDILKREAAAGVRRQGSTGPDRHRGVLPQKSALPDQGYRPE